MGNVGDQSAEKNAGPHPEPAEYQGCQRDPRGRPNRRRTRMLGRGQEQAQAARSEISGGNQGVEKDQTKQLVHASGGAAAPVKAVPEYEKSRAAS